MDVVTSDPYLNTTDGQRVQPLKSEWITLGEMRLHVPSVVVGGLRLVTAAFGTSRPFRDELMQAWFDGFGALLATNGCGLSKQEASEYMRSTLATLLPHSSESARKHIMKSFSEVSGECHDSRKSDSCGGI